MKTLVLLCKDVIDHGHCSTSVWKTDDDRATLQLYLLESEGKPTVGDLLDVDVALGEEEQQLFTRARETFGQGPATDLLPGIRLAEQMRSQTQTFFPLDPPADPRPSFPGYQAALRQDLAGAMGMPGSNTTVVHSDELPTLFPPDHEPQPPIDNEHVAEGCEQFADPTATHEAVSSLDTPGQILGAAAEHTGSD